MAENESLDIGGAYAKRWDVMLGVADKHGRSGWHLNNGKSNGNKE